MSERSARRFRWTPGLICGLVLLGLIVLDAIVAPLVLGKAADALGGQASAPPGAGHPLGTDDFGRDVLDRSLVAARLTLVMTVCATGIAVVGGVLIGTAIQLPPRVVREGVLRLIDAAVAYPALISALLIAAILGPGTWSAVFAIGIAGIPSFSRLTANLAASVSQREFVATARLLGVPGRVLIGRHLLPNMAEPLLVLTASSFALTLVEISSLSFVGLGVQNPEYDFGRLLNDGLVNIYSQPLQAIAPSAMIVLTGLGAMLTGDGFAAAADPRGARRPLARTGLSRKALSSRAVADAALGQAPDAGPVVRVEGLRVRSQAGKELVRGVSFEIREGEVVGLVGESGSGKSLTAMALAGLLADGLAAEADELRVGDLDLHGRPDPTRLATEIGLVYQDPGTTFNPALRLGPQLTEVSRVHLKTPKREASAQMVQGLADIRVTQPEHRLHQHPHELSGGMLQRAAIASALMTDPRLIVADEPTTALDVTVQAEVLRQFRRINRSRGTAMLFISHDIGVVQALCDYVLVMNRGVILERLTGAQLAAGEVSHPYTKALLAANPSMTERVGELSAVRWSGPEEGEETA